MIDVFSNSKTDVFVYEKNNKSLARFFKDKTC